MNIWIVRKQMRLTWKPKAFPEDTSICLCVSFVHVLVGHARAISAYADQDPSYIVDTKRETKYHSSDTKADSNVDRITQTLTKSIVIAAHLDPTFGTYKLRLRKSNTFGGAGKWDFYLWSDSVGLSSLRTMIHRN